MPRTGGAERREHIVLHAARLFRIKGYSSTSISDILKEAEISRGAFYFYFASKSKLGEAVVDYYGRSLPHLLEESFGGKGWAEGSAVFVEAFLGPPGGVRDTVLPLGSLAIEFSQRNRELLDRAARVLVATEEKVASFLASYLPSAAQARQAASTFTAVAEGHVMRYSLTKEKRCRAQMVSDIMALGKGGARGPRRRRDVAKKKALDIVDDRSIISVQERGSVGSSSSEKRLEIVRCAAVLFWLRGYHSTSLEDILKECNVPKGSFHYYFKSKRALASAALDFQRVGCEQFLGEVLSRATWRDCVEALCGPTVREIPCSRVLDWPMGNMGLEFANNDAVLGRKAAMLVSTMEDAFAGSLTRYVQQADRIADLAARAVALWQGHLMRMVITRDASVMEDLKADLLALVG